MCGLLVIRLLVNFIFIKSFICQAGLLTSTLCVKEGLSLPIMSSNQPNKIYRYQRFSATTVESLCHDQLHFADPGAFNDPLDCQPTVELDSDRDTLRLLLTELVRRRIEAEAISSLKSAKLKGKKAAV